MWVIYPLKYVVNLYIIILYNKLRILNLILTNKYIKYK